MASQQYGRHDRVPIFAEKKPKRLNECNRLRKKKLSQCDPLRLIIENHWCEESLLTNIEQGFLSDLRSDDPCNRANNRSLYAL